MECRSSATKFDPSPRACCSTCLRELGTECAAQPYELVPPDVGPGRRLEDRAQDLAVPAAQCHGVWWHISPPPFKDRALASCRSTAAAAITGLGVGPGMARRAGRAMLGAKRPAWAGGSVVRKVMATAREGRRGGREARRQERTSMQVAALPVLDRKIPVYEILGEESLERIHQASLDILEQIGIEFRDAEAAADVARCRRRGRPLPGAHPGRRCSWRWSPRTPNASPCAPATPSAAPRSAATRSRSRRLTDRRSSMTSTTSGAMPRSPTCKNSTSSPIWRRPCTTPVP